MLNNILHNMEINIKLNIKTIQISVKNFFKTFSNLNYSKFEEKILEYTFQSKDTPKRKRYSKP